MFCGKAAEMKKGKYKRAINKMSTIEFKDNVIKRANERGDSLGKLVKNRIIFYHDLIAAEAKYHRIYHVNFLNPARLSTRDKPRENDKIIVAMEEIFCYIENNEDSQFTLNDCSFRDVLTRYVPDYSFQIQTWLGNDL